MCCRLCLAMHSSTQGNAFVLQLADLKRKENGAQVGERGSVAQLSQPCFERDPAPGNDSVFPNRFHCLLISERKPCQPPTSGSWLLCLFIVNISATLRRTNEIKRQ
jgi:hypothetical protein